MAKRTNKEKQLQVIKNGKIGVSLFWYLIMLGIIIGVIAFSLMLILYNTVTEKMRSEYEKISYLAQLYEQGQKQGINMDGLYAYAERDYFLLDPQGNVVAGRGENTCTMKAGKVLLSGWSFGVDAYEDADGAWLSHDERDHTFSPDYGYMIKRIWDGKSILEENLEDDEEFGLPEDEESYEDALEKSNAFYRQLDEKMVCFPVWYSFDVLDGWKFVGKATMLVSYSDAVWIMASALMILLLLALILILVIINLSRGAHRQMKVVDAFMTDPVTQGHNWIWFLSKMEPMLKRRKNAEKNFAVIEMVFVNYRTFCSCHSLEEGEEVLRKVNTIITKYLVKKEACAHVAASSFAILINYENESGLRARLRDLIEVLENVDPNHKFSFHVGVRILAAETDENGNVIRRKNLDLEKEYNNACMARASLSDSDESRIAFFDNQLVEEQKWIDIVQERQAEAVEKEEFTVYYQPKYDPQSKKLRGAEALIRWNSPEWGFVSPGRFIPIFEKNGFITEIDHYMIDHVARDQKAWMDEGYKCVPVSVNISRAHFIESDLAEQIKTAVDKAGTPHELIEIELTESAFFDDKNAMIETITRLKDYGFRVSMDDFGSGYSSLNSLKDMPLDVLKLDAEFFRGDQENGRGEIVVAEAIKLAKSLNMYTVAEGVEDAAQVEFLAQQGCDMIQGYYFAKPMPKADYEECMRNEISDRAEDAPRQNVSDETEESAS